ncbi:MAG: hypothetical protein LQ351_003075 [Letrouitia transgressa]|nr:MAG: hypothetical protein LQ351_003075 [Letrouitia transgressa]
MSTIPFSQLTQQRLAVFIVNEETGGPLPKVPVYAEASISLVRPNKSSEEKERFFIDSDNFAELPRLRSLKELTRTAILENVDFGNLSQGLAADQSEQTYFNNFVESVLALYKAKGWLSRDSSATIDKDAVEGVVRSAARRPGILRVEESALEKRQRVPMGVLATDHTGFVSFDLTRVSSLHDERVATFSTQVVSYNNPRNSHKVSLTLYHGLLQNNRVDVLATGRIGNDSILCIVEVPKDYKGRRPTLSLPALQNPHLIDWKVSPGSFAAVPQTMIGVDGCESFTPANFATTEFPLRQVQRLISIPNDTFKPLSGDFPSALVVEYMVRLKPIGHSLGQVVYSCPLAPGESVRLAVIDWRRNDLGVRGETTTFDEALLHDQSRDRVITETVKAAIEEWQRGGSVMGGISGGAGGAASSGSYGAAGGIMASIGGAYTTSKGSRNITVDTTQKVADAIHQASNSSRELHSSVVVQTSQAEKENVETRAFANHNRAHTMTVLYYEVLRHYHLEVKFRRVYEATLVGRNSLTWGTVKTPETASFPPVINLSWDLTSPSFLLAKRYILEPALLDSSLAAGFESLVRYESARRRISEVYAENQVKTVDESQYIFNRFKVVIMVVDGTEGAVEVRILKTDQTSFALKFQRQTNINAEAFGTKLKEGYQSQPFMSDNMGDTEAIKWGDMQNMYLAAASDAGSDHFSAMAVTITAYKKEGGTETLSHAEKGLGPYNLSGPQTIATVAIKTPAPPTYAPNAAQMIGDDDYNLMRLLIEHLNFEQAYYKRVLDLATNPQVYATFFENIDVADSDARSSKLLSHVDPTPIDILGDKIAFPRLDNPNAAAIKTLYNKTLAPEERLISLPTRGLFAEAKLGHCNVTEEIDETRFWKWEEHPLPVVAPDIAPVEVATPENKPPNTDPTPFPTPIINIQTPQALPDPTGAAAALKALTTPDVFRDMSGVKDVQAMLHDLTEGAVKMAQAASKNLETGVGAATADSQGKRDQETKLAQMASDERKADKQQTTPAEAQHAIKLADNMVTQGKMKPAERDEIVKNQTKNMKGSTPAPPPAPPAPAPTPPKDPLRARQLELIIQGYDNAPMAGRYQISLSQQGHTLEGSFIPDTTYPNGLVQVHYKPFSERPKLVLSCVGEVLYGKNKGLIIEGDATPLDIPLDLWEKYEFNQVLVTPWTQHFKTKSKSVEETIKKFNLTVNAGAGAEGEVNKVAKVSAKADAGLNWTPGDTDVTFENETEMDLQYYQGGLRVVKID